jgi:hypothetical protein
VTEIPPVVRAKAEVAGAGAWLAGLPSLIAGLESEWGIRVGRPFTEGTEAYVAEATRADGTPAVLKLMIPRPGDHAGHEITVLRLAGGEGCARLLAADERRGAMLLERLGDPVELMAGDPWDRAYRLAARTGTDPVAIWEWGVVERVSTGLIAEAIGLQPVGAQMLAAADQIARHAA